MYVCMYVCVYVCMYVAGSSRGSKRIHFIKSEDILPQQLHDLSATLTQPTPKRRRKLNKEQVLCVRMYVCMYVYVYVCMYMCVYVCVYVYVCMYVCMYVCANNVDAWTKDYCTLTCLFQVYV